MAGPKKPTKASYIIEITFPLPSTGGLLMLEAPMLPTL